MPPSCPCCPLERLVQLFCDDRQAPVGAKGFSPGSSAPRADGLNPNPTHRHLLCFRKSKQVQERKQVSLASGEGMTGDWNRKVCVPLAHEAGRCLKGKKSPFCGLFVCLFFGNLQIISFHPDFVIPILQMKESRPFEVEL